MALANVCRAVQVLALAIFKLRAEVPPREIGEVPIVMLPLLVSPIFEFVKLVLAIVVEAKSHLLLKVFQSVEVKYPLTAVAAAGRETTPLEYDKGELKVVVAAP